MKKARKQEYAPIKDLIMQNKCYKYLYQIVSMSEKTLLFLFLENIAGHKLRDKTQDQNKKIDC